MFKARGTRQLFAREASVAAPTQAQRQEPLVDDPGYGRADDAEPSLMFGMTPTLPPLPANFKERVLAARAGDLDAIREMREIGEAIPPDMHVPFAEMVENMLGEGDV